MTNPDHEYNFSLRTVAFRICLCMSVHTFTKKWGLYSDTWVHTCTSTYIVVLGSCYMLKNTWVVCCSKRSKLCFKNLFSTLNFFLWCHLFVSLGFSFIDIDPDPKAHVERIIIELNGTTNYSISCRTTDVNDVTTLFHGQEVTVGGRVTLDKQVFTIHGISSSDTGLYTCKARNGSGAVIKQDAVFIYPIKGKPSDKWIQHQPVWGWVWVGQWPYGECAHLWSSVLGLSPLGLLCGVLYSHCASPTQVYKWLPANIIL